MVIVPQSKYDLNYYKVSCDGYDISGRLPGRLKSLLKYMGDGKNVIDIGCGRGEVAKYLSDKFVISLDYSIASMKMFYENNKNKPFICSDIAQGLQWLVSNFFDYIILADIIEHVNDDILTTLSKDVMRLLKQNGMILIDTPINAPSSELHINIKNSIQQVVDIFKGTELVVSEWYKNPEHCHIILRKV